MTIQIHSAVQLLITFIETHFIYWVVLVALVFEFRYLLHKDRREAIAMSRLGSASRHEQPAYFYFLWVLHAVAALIFTLLVIGYLSRLW